MQRAQAAIARAQALNAGGAAAAARQPPRQTDAPDWLDSDAAEAASRYAFAGGEAEEYVDLSSGRGFF
jgi:hypothetical protein